jgi:hypothetical protein
MVLMSGGLLCFSCMQLWKDYFVLLGVDKCTKTIHLKALSIVIFWCTIIRIIWEIFMVLFNNYMEQLSKDHNKLYWYDF